MTFVLTEEAAPGVRLLTLNRPEKRNAVNQQMFDELTAAFRSVDAHEEVRAVVLTGAGTAFCAGVDLKDVGDPALLEQRRRAGVSPAAALLQVQTPVIAAVNGACVAGGLELVLACDIVVAADEATFADAHLQLGLLPSWGGGALLPLAVGLRRAKELALTGRFATALEAERYGLVAQVVAPEALLSTAMRLATRIAAAPADKVRSLLRIYDEGAGLAERMALERRVLLASQLDLSGCPPAGGVTTNVWESLDIAELRRDQKSPNSRGGGYPERGHISLSGRCRR